MSRAGSQRRELVFHGHVQGVGFRMTTEGIAGEHEVTGWVRNEADGTVRCLVEGHPGAIDGFLAQVHETMSGYIVDTQSLEREATGEFDQFKARYR